MSGSGLLAALVNDEEGRRCATLTDLAASGLNHGDLPTIGGRLVFRAVGGAWCLGNLAFFSRFRRAVVVPHRQPAAFPAVQCRLLNVRSAARDIFLAVNRRDMRRIPAEVRPADAKFLAVGID